MYDGLNEREHSAAENELQFVKIGRDRQTLERFKFGARNALKFLEHFRLNSENFTNNQR